MNSLAKNSIYNVIARCTKLLFPLVTAIYVSRIILPEGVGKVASAQNIVSYFVLIASMGIPIYGVKKIAEYKDNTKKRSKIFSELVVINSFSSIFCSLIYISLVFNVSYFQDKTSLSLITGSLLFANVFSIDWFYQGLEKYKYAMIRTMIATVVSIILVFLLVKDQSDFIVYAAISTFYSLVSFAFDFVFAYRYAKLTLSGLDFKRHIKPVLILLSSNIAIEIYVLADVTMLNLLKGDTVVGYYSTAMKVVVVIRALVVAISAVYLPRLSSLHKGNRTNEFVALAKEGLHILISLSVPATVGVAVISDDFIPLFFGVGFSEASLTMKILSVSVISVAISNFTGYQVLMVIGKEKQVMLSTLFGAIINIILNVLLINPFAQNGAAIASVITELIVMLYQVIVLYKYGYKLFDVKNIISVITSTAVMFIGLLLMNRAIQVAFVRIILDVSVGATIYFIMSVLTGNPVAKDVIKQITGKFIGDKDVQT